MKTQTEAIRDSIGGAIDVHKCHCSTKRLFVFESVGQSQFSHGLSSVGLEKRVRHGQVSVKNDSYYFKQTQKAAVC